MTEVTGVSPDSGPTTGGTTVTFTGVDFTVVTEVAFGSVPASYRIVSGSEIIATAAAKSAGTVDVRMWDLAGLTPVVVEFTCCVRSDGAFGWLTGDPSRAALSPQRGRGGGVR